MVLRYNEVFGNDADDLMLGTSGAIQFGLGGADTFQHGAGATAEIFIGGTGSDIYDMGGLPGSALILEQGGAADSLLVTGLWLTRATTTFVTIDGGRHLAARDSASGEAVVVWDWALPAHRIESFTLGEGSFTYSGLVTALTAKGTLADLSWAQAVADGYLALPADGTVAEIAPTLSALAQRAMSVEGATFAVTDTATGAATSANPFATAAAGVTASTYAGPVPYVDLQLIGTGAGEAIGGTPFADFINAGGGDDAVSAGVGDDVIDGGTGSNFLTGGAGFDVFFLDGRGGGTTWSTITDFAPGEQLSLWGWRPGVSRATWVDSDGAAGFRGVTLHADLDGNGSIDASVTWSGLTRAALPAGLEFDGLLWFR